VAAAAVQSSRRSPTVAVAACPFTGASDATALHCTALCRPRSLHCLHARMVRRGQRGQGLRPVESLRFAAQSSRSSSPAAAPAGADATECVKRIASRRHQWRARVSARNSASGIASHRIASRRQSNGVEGVDATAHGDGYDRRLRIADDGRIDWPGATPFGTKESVVSCTRIAALRSQSEWTSEPCGSERRRRRRRRRRRNAAAPRQRRLLHTTRQRKDGAHQTRNTNNSATTLPTTQSTDDRGRATTSCLAASISTKLSTDTA
jgi:hypothetical protein